MRKEPTCRNFPQPGVLSPSPSLGCCACNCILLWRGIQHNNAHSTYCEIRAGACHSGAQNILHKSDCPRSLGSSDTQFHGNRCGHNIPQFLDHTSRAPWAGNKSSSADTTLACPQQKDPRCLQDKLCRDHLPLGLRILSSLSKVSGP